MLWTVTGALAVIWLIATVLEFTLGGLIHILLLVALGLLLWRFLKSRTARGRFLARRRLAPRRSPFATNPAARPPTTTGERR